MRKSKTNIMLQLMVAFLFLVLAEFAGAQVEAPQSPLNGPLGESIAAAVATTAPVVAGTDADDAGEETEEAEKPEAEESTETGTVTQEADVAELERRIDVLSEELELLRSGETQAPRLTPDEARRLGLAPSAAATYSVDQGVSLSGYGEMLVENYANKAGTKSDMLRAILYTGYRFNDKFLFNSEIEVEHGKEIYVEFAYIDYQIAPNVGLRGGMLLAPMGLTNEFHEPTVFMGAERPVTENKVIPSTWRENGGGIYGAFDKVAFRAYVMNGFNGQKFSSGGVRGGRQKGAKAKSTSMAFTGRFDITPTPGVFFGASLYTGDSGQGEVIVNSTEYGVKTTIYDFHAWAQVRGFDVRALFARANLDDVIQLNEFLGKTGSAGVAEGMQGAYVQFGYNILSQVAAAGNTSLMPYIRFEQVDTQDKMASGFTRSLKTDNNYVTFGVELKPTTGVVLKVDHMWVTNDAGTGTDQFNVNLGYAF